MNPENQGRFPTGHLFLSVFFFFIFSVLMLNYIILDIWNYKKAKNHPLTFNIELCTKVVGWGVKFDPPER